MTLLCCLVTREEQTTQWPKENLLKDKQRSTKHTHKTKARVTRTPLKSGGEQHLTIKKSSLFKHIITIKKVISMQE
jgi:hypothetical protein